MNAFQLVKDTLQEISREEAAAYEEQINGYRRNIKQYATEDQKDAYKKAVAFGWHLSFADQDSIELEKLDAKSTLVIYRDGSSSRERRLSTTTFSQEYHNE